LLHLQGEVNGGGEKGINMDMEYKRGAEPSSQLEAERHGLTASRKQER
jgi:hypothetical protein